MNHPCLKELWSTLDPQQTHLVDAIVRLWCEAHPLYQEKCKEMGYIFFQMETFSSVVLIFFVFVFFVWLACYLLDRKSCVAETQVFVSLEFVFYRQSDRKQKIIFCKSQWLPYRKIYFGSLSWKLNSSWEMNCTNRTHQLELAVYIFP